MGGLPQHECPTSASEGSRAPTLTSVMVVKGVPVSIPSATSSPRAMPRCTPGAGHMNWAQDAREPPRALLGAGAVWLHGRAERLRLGHLLLDGFESKTLHNPVMKQNNSTLQHSVFLPSGLGEVMADNH